VPLLYVNGKPPTGVEVVAFPSDVGDALAHSHAPSSGQFPAGNGVTRTVVDNTIRGSSGSITRRRTTGRRDLVAGLNPSFRNVLDQEEENLRIATSFMKAGHSGRGGNFMEHSWFERLLDLEATPSILASDLPVILSQAEKLTTDSIRAA
jgi:hypothetical protein